MQVAAPPGCEAQARWGYGTLIGLPELEKPEPLRARGGAWFGLGDEQLHIGVEESFAPAAKAHPAVRFEQRMSCMSSPNDSPKLGRRFAGTKSCHASSDSSPTIHGATG